MKNNKMGKEVIKVMSVFFENQQDRIAINDNIKGLVERAVMYSLQMEGFELPTEISVLFVDNVSIKEINKKHRNIDSPTDVLSFPLVDIENGKINSFEGDLDIDEESLLLGDIVISIDKVESQAMEYGHSFERELGFLVTHGVFHLLGYDHLDNNSEKIMLEKQEAVLLRLGMSRK